MRLRIRNWGAMLLLVGALLLLLACGSDDATPTATQAPAATTPPAAGETPAAPAARAETPAPTSATDPAPTEAPARPTATAMPAPPPDEKLQVVTTSNIVADWARAVGQDRVDVFSLIPPNADPHSYQPGARDIARVADADVVLSVGLSLETEWLDELVENAARSPEAVIALGDLVEPIDFVELFDDHDDHDDHGAEGETALMGRLLIGDGETGGLSIIDLEHGEVSQNVFDLGSRAGRIYPTSSGRYAIAVSSDANNVEVFDGGIYWEEHGDHFDLVEQPVAPVGLDLMGDRPVHLYVGGEWAAIFYDGSGEVVLLNEHEIEERGAAYSPPSFNAGPHHGAAVPLEDDLFAVGIQHPDYASAPDDYRLPIGAEIVDGTGRSLFRAEEECPGLHGDASNGHMGVFGCEGGVLFVEAHDGAYESGFIAGPDGSPDDFRLTSVWGHYGLDHFFALGGAFGLYVVEPEDGAMEQLIASSEALRPINVAVSHNGKYLLVVMSDGELRMYDAHNLDLLASKSGFLTQPVATGFWERPHIATAPGAVFITDSVGGEVIQLDTHDLDEVAHWEVAGTPTKIAFVGIHGEADGHDDHMEHGHDEHGDEEEHEEEHGEEEHEDEHGHHGHAHGDLDPHFWFDPTRTQQAVNSIAAQFTAVDPDGAAYYRDNAAAYNRELDDLDAWVMEQVAVLPVERRLLVTNHDAFQYYAQRYGFQVIGAVFPTSTSHEPTAQELAELIEAIEHNNVPAVFTEHSHSQRLTERVAESTGAEIVGTLYTGSLSEPGEGAESYIDLMRYNTGIIVEALR